MNLGGTCRKIQSKGGILLATIPLEETRLLKSNINVLIAQYEREHGRVKRKDIAERIGITPQYLTTLASGKIKAPNTEVLFRLAAFLGVKVDDLFEYKEDDE